MLDRLVIRAALLTALAFTVAGCTNPLVISLAVTPTAQTLSVGQTVQFTATGTYGHGSNHPSSTQNETTQVTWTSSSPAVATVSATGLATAVAPGSTTITASINGFTGLVTSTATLTVSGSGVGSGTTPTSDVTSITVIPGSQSVSSPGGIATFIPIGTESTGATINLTGEVAWASSSNQIATVNSAGTATAVTQGTATITAVYTNADKTVATGTAAFQILTSASEQVTSLSIFPGSQAATSLGQQSQFTVLGTENGVQYDLTGQVAWTSSTSSVATIDTAPSPTPGLVTATAAGTTTIEATYVNKDGSHVVATATYSVTAGTSPEPLLSINVVPAGTSVSNKGMTGQYLAFGTFSTPPLVRDITDEVSWISLLPEVASINSGGTAGELAGLATAQGYTGNTVIYAEDTKTNPDGTIVLSNSQTFTCKDPVTSVCDQQTAQPQFATVTIFVEGENTSSTGEFVTAPSDTGTPNLIHCGPDWTGSGGQVCTGTYETGSTVVLTENLPAGSSFFGGWSAGDGVSPTNTCQEAGDPVNSSILRTSTTCTLTLNGNASVGVIFY